MDFVSIIYILCFLLSWASLHHVLSRFSRRYRSLPPGPTPLPIVGNLFSLGGQPHVSLARWARIYGPVMSLQLGSVRTVVISSPAAAKEVLQTQDASLSYKFILDCVRAGNTDEYSVIWRAPDAIWRCLRKIVHSQIFSSNKLDSRSNLLKEKISQLLSHVDGCCRAGTAVDVPQLAFNTVANLLSSTIFSVDIAGETSTNTDGDDCVDGREFKDLMWEIMLEAGKPNLSDFFPLVKKLDLQGIRGRMDVYVAKWLDLFDRMIAKRLLLRSARSGIGGVDSTGGNNGGDVLDALLEMSEGNTEGFTRDFIPHLLLIRMKVKLKNVIDNKKIKHQERWTSLIKQN